MINLFSMAKFADGSIANNVFNVVYIFEKKLTDVEVTGFI